MAKDKSSPLGTAYVDVQPKMSSTAETVITSALGKASIGSAIGGTIGGGMELGLAKSLGGVAKKLLPALGIADLAMQTVDLFSTSLNNYMGFESAMSGVQAVMGATDEEMEQLNAVAMEMGSTTQFTAAQSAEALQYMGTAGWTASQSIEGLPAVLNLAAASGESLGTTADIVTDALTALGLKAEDAAHFADILAAAATSSNTNVYMMGETFKYAAPLAGALGFSAEDLAFNIGLMANAGIKGSMAGTALRSTLTRLADPPKDAAMAMDELGISMTNADGSMKGLNEIMEDCRVAFADLTPEQQAQYASAIAGQEAMSGFLAIVNAAPEDMGRLAEAIDGADGAAAEMAATKTDNLEGDLTRLSSAVDALYLKIGEDLAPMARELVQWATDTLIPSLENIIGMFEGIAGAIETAVSWLNQFVPKSEAVDLGNGQVGLKMQDGSVISGAGYYDPDGNYVSLASGGIALGPTHALIAEAGKPEMVMPLSDDATEPFAAQLARQMSTYAAAAAGWPGGGVGNVGVYLDGRVLVGHLVSEIDRELGRLAR